MAIEAGNIPLYYGTDKVKFMIPDRSAVFTSSFLPVDTEGGMKKFVEHILHLKSDYEAFSAYFHWNKAEYTNRKLVKNCKYNWQCKTCEWVQNRLEKRRQKLKQQKI